MSIRIEGLEVRYGTQLAVAGLSLEVPEGACFGLLGPNGAGKSSTIRCVATVQRPSAGRITVAGRDVGAEPDQVRRILGMVPQSLALWEALSVVENLRIFAGLAGLRGARLRERVDWGLGLAQLGEHASKRVESLSGGMKRRLNLAVSLLHDPRVLILDEPTTGVDPQSRNHLFDSIRALHREGRTVVYTTHYMEEVEALCDRVAIVDHGRLVACESLDGLRGRGGPTGFRVELAAPAEADAVQAALRAAGLAAEVRAEGRSLEQVFLELTGHALRDQA